MEGVKRRYDSSRRQEQARENRRRIVAAAQALFVDKGYGRTTITDVADAAGVAAETVYAAFRNKPTLLHRVWDVAVGGDEQDVHLLDRPEMRAVFAEPNLDTRLILFAEVNTEIMRRTAPLLRALRGAAASEPAATSLVAEADGARLEAMRTHAAAAAGTERLAVSEEECRDVLWSTTDGTLWHRLVAERGWTDDRYATWLGRLWVSMLVADDKETAGEPSSIGPHDGARLRPRFKGLTDEESFRGSIDGRVGTSGLGRGGRAGAGRVRRLHDRRRPAGRLSKPLANDRLNRARDRRGVRDAAGPLEQRAGGPLTRGCSYLPMAVLKVWVSASCW